MTKISFDDVRKVATLARLDLPDNEIALYAKQLEKIIGYIEHLDQVDTDQISPTTRAVEVVNISRKDVVNKTEIRDDLLNLAPSREGDFFKVPKILPE